MTTISRNDVTKSTKMMWVTRPYLVVMFETMLMLCSCILLFYYLLISAPEEDCLQFSCTVYNDNIDIQLYSI